MRYRGSFDPNFDIVPYPEASANILYCCALILKKSWLDFLIGNYVSAFVLARMSYCESL